MNRKHTLGPWKIDLSMKQLFVTDSMGRQMICSLSPNFEESEANAKLIATAPELLGTLSLIYAVIISENPEKKLNFIKNLCIEGIKKATK